MMNKMKKQKVLRFLLFFSVAFAMISIGVFAVFIKEGKSFLWNYDGMKQHFDALIYLGKYYRQLAGNILHGNFTLPMFDFSVGLGEDILTTLNFYGLGDPLTLLAAVVPAKNQEILYNFLVIVRMYFAGLSFAVFCYHKRMSFNGTLLGAIAYCFSGYLLHVAVKHPFFVIPMIFLPLMIVGFERGIHKKKWSFFILVIFCTAWNGFYFFYMNTLFLLLYAAVHVITWQRKKHYRFGHGVWELGKVAGKCALCYVVGIAMAAILFLPAVMAFLESARAESGYRMTNILFYDWDRYNAILTRMIGSPRITWAYAGFVALLVPALVLLFMKKKRELKAHALVWFVLMLIPVTGYIFNGFSYATERYMYVVAFVFAWVLTAMYPSLCKITKKQGIVCLVAMGIYIALMIFSSDPGKLSSWFGAIMLGVTMIVLGIPMPRARKGYALIILASLNVVGNAFFLYSSMGQNYVDEFIDAGKGYKILANAPESVVKSCDDSEFYRVDGVSEISENTGMVTGKYGVSSYYSISNMNHIEAQLKLQNAGILDSIFKLEGVDDRSYLGHLLSVRYYTVPAGNHNVPNGFEWVKSFETKTGKYDLYENPWVLPLGFTYDSYVKEADVKGMNPLELQKKMLESVIVKEDVPALESMPTTTEKEEKFCDIQWKDLKNAKLDGNTLIVEKDKGSVTVSWDDVPGEKYLHLGQYRMSNSKNNHCDISVSVDGREKLIPVTTNTWNWYYGRKEYWICLGSKITKPECKITFEKRGRFELDDFEIVAQSMDGQQTLLEQRGKESLQHLQRDTNKISGTIQVLSPKMLFFSIPYSAGWHATVDGKESKIYQANYGYMAVQLSEGLHDVVLQYQTPHLKKSLLISAVGWLVFFVFSFFFEKMHRNLYFFRKKN